MKISQPQTSGSQFSVSALTATTTTYGVTPTVGNYSANSSSSVMLSGGGVSYSGGVLRAKVLSQSGSSFTIQISKQDGSAFTMPGVAKVKAGSISGGLAGSAGYSVGNTSVNVTISATFTQGVTHFYPMVEASIGGSKYYAEPIMVYTLPSYASGPYYDGMPLATVDGVGLVASGPGNIDDKSDGISTWQCTDFCKRYYSSVYSLSFSGWGNANQWYTNPQTLLNKYGNGGSVAPRVGDILCLSGGPIPPGQTQGNGHVAIITEVSSTEIKMANQNGGTGSFYPIGWTLSRSGNSVSSPSGYTVQGWLRKP